MSINVYKNGAFIGTTNDLSLNEAGNIKISPTTAPSGLISYGLSSSISVEHNTANPLTGSGINFLDSDTLTWTLTECNCGEVNVSGTITALGGSTLSNCSAYTSINIAIPGAGHTLINWDSTDFDTDNYHITTDRLIAPATGKYEIKLNPNMSGNAVDQFTFTVFINGNIASPFGRTAIWGYQSPTNGVGSGLSFSAIGKLSSGDYIQVDIARTGSGTVDLVGTLGVNSTFQIMRIA